MASKDDVQLVFALEAKAREFEKTIERAEKKFSGQTGKMERRAKQASTNVERTMAGMAKNVNGIAGKMFAPLLALGAAGVIREMGQIAGEIAGIGDAAKRAGIDVKRFQELKYVAEQNRIGVDTLTDGIREMQIKIAEFDAGGSGDAFQRLGYSAEELTTKLHDPSELFSEIIGKLGQIDRATAISLADQIFGGSAGEQFVQLIDQGAEGIRATQQEARDLGLIFDQELIDKAADLDRKFNTVATTVGTALKTAVVEASNALSVFLDQFRAIEDREYVRPLQNQLANLYNQREFLKEELVKLQDGFQIPLISDHAMESVRAKLAEIDEEAHQLLERINILQGMPVPGAPAKPTPAPIVPIVPPGGGGGGGGGGRTSRSVASETDAVLKLIDALKWEGETMKMTGKELAIANALRDAGAGASAEQRLEIEALVGANFDLKESIDANAAAMQQFGQMAEDALGQFIDDMIEGKDLAESFGGILKSLASQLIKTGLGAPIGTPFTINLRAA